jgi:hypothetical protein
VLLLVLSTPALAHAQFRLGISAELNRHSFGGVAPDDAAYESNFGAGFAAILEYRVHNDVVLSLQPGWLQKGANIVFNEDEEPDSVETFVVEQTWVTIPLYFRIDSDNRGLYAGGGISLDLLLDSTIEHDGVESDNKAFFEDTDVVYQFAAGYMHSWGKRTWFLEARYMQGLTSINSSARTTAGDVYVADFKSIGARFVAGIIF